MASNIATASYCMSMLDKHWPQHTHPTFVLENLNDSDYDLLYDFADYARRIENLCEKSYEEYVFQVQAKKDLEETLQCPNGLLHAYGESECAKADYDAEIFRLIDAVDESDINRIKAIIVTILN
jgi:hypothetical protein